MNFYNAGHMYEAAVAHFQATGKRTFLDVAIKNADLIDKEFGWGKLEKYPGHQEIEIGFVKLYGLPVKRNTSNWLNICLISAARRMGI